MNNAAKAYVCALRKTLLPVRLQAAAVSPSGSHAVAAINRCPASNAVATQTFMTSSFFVLTESSTFLT